MKALDTLITQLKEFKEDLAKNAKDISHPADQPSSVKSFKNGVKTTNVSKVPGVMAQPNHKDLDWSDVSKGDFGLGETGRVRAAPVRSMTPSPSTPKFKGSDIQIKGGKLSGPGLTMPPTAPKGFTKTINESYSEEPNMAKEEMKVAKNGQWNLETKKAEDCK